MTNQVIIIGRLVSDPQINETENGNKICTIALAVPRSYRNINGEYDTDFIDCVLYKGVAETTSEYCRKGDLMAIKGSIQRLSGEDLKIVADKVTFLSSKQ